ncbi:hypothetical protein ACFWQC_01765 [Nocardioides sp. NPDC058538]
MREFRTRFIADVVTGQVDVQDIAASLLEGEMADAAAQVAAVDSVEVDD